LLATSLSYPPKAVHEDALRPRVAKLHISG
jgi:hypothetical protein